MEGERWTPEEEGNLRGYFSNLDRDVFALKLPQEVAGALFSRYSRSAKSLRRTFLDEFLGEAGLALPEAEGGGTQDEAVKKARAFYERVLVGYGDDSVAQLGGAHLACENISNVAANLIEDARIGIAPLEKSTRYVRFDKKDDQGRYLYHREARIMASRHAAEYVAAMDHLFETYSALMDPVLDLIRRKLPIEQLEFKHPKTGDIVGFGEASRDLDLARWAETAYRSTVRAHACDVLRGLLPAATLTNVGLFGNGQAFEYLMTKSYSSPVTEMRNLAEGMHRELNQMIPSFVRRAAPSDYLTGVRKETGTVAGRFAPAGPVAEPTEVRLIDYDEGAEEKVIAAILFGETNQGLADLISKARAMAQTEREAVLAAYLARRRNRREKPGRALENAVYTFEIVCNLGIYRDLHRHRLLTQERQRFTCALGSDLPEEIREVGATDRWTSALEGAAQLWGRLDSEMPVEAQYVVPFAYRLRWYLTANLRELYHLVELRTMPQGHPDYRRVSQKIWVEIEKIHPTLAAHGKFVDRDTYHLGRLQSELRTEFKRSNLQ